MRSFYYKDISIICSGRAGQLPGWVLVQLFLGEEYDVDGKNITAL